MSDTAQQNHYPDPPQALTASSYVQRRDELENYFDRTAAKTWERLTSDAPVSGIRATVRAGREEMRHRLLSWLPENLTGKTILDAGCGTGSLSVAAARRGADVLAIDLSPSLIDVARHRVPDDVRSSITFLDGDMLGEATNRRFDYVVAMDSLIHYGPCDMTNMIARLAGRARTSVLFTFAPKTALLSVMHKVGKLFPRSDRSPAIEPIAEHDLRSLIGSEVRLHNWSPTRTHLVSCGFYKSQAMELRRENSEVPFPE